MFATLHTSFQKRLLRILKVVAKSVMIFALGCLLVIAMYYAALESRNIYVVRFFLKMGLSPNMSFWNYEYPLRIAVSNCDIQMCQLLIAYHADVNKGRDSGFPPLDHAVAKRDLSHDINIRNNYYPLIKYLLQHGADPNAYNVLGGTAFINCPCGDIDDVEIIKLLLSNGAEINSVDRNGNTALTNAVLSGYYNTAKYLIDKGINVNIKTIQGETALDSAAEFQHTDIMNYIVSHGGRYGKDINGP